MSKTRRCMNCDKKVFKTEKECPFCGSAFLCKKCGKELDDGTQKYCSVCKMETEEKRNKIGKKVVTAVGGTIAIVVAVVVRKNNKSV